jgi:membrane-bound ClpP family serine protease
MTGLTWAAVLLLLALILVSLEVLIPSLGALGVLAVASILAAAFVAYRDAGIGGAIGVLAIASILAPIVIFFAFRLFPHTPLGSIILKGPTEPELDDLEGAELRRLVGQRGVARSHMLPSGAVRIGASTYDAVSEGLPIDSGQSVVVVAVRMNRVVVRPVAGEAPPAPATPQDEILSQPIDQLGIEALDLTPPEERK